MLTERLQVWCWRHRKENPIKCEYAADELKDGVMLGLKLSSTWEAMVRLRFYVDDYVHTPFCCLLSSL